MRYGRIIAAFGLYLGLVVAGCASTGDLGQWTGPVAATPTTVQEWTFGEDKARVLKSAHYHIYTTIEDEEMLQLLPQVMEGAHAMYRDVAPGVAISEKPMDCFIFRWRSEWDQYTQRYTGTDARVYLQIRSGGYTLRDRYVAYYIGRLGTFSVASHEGWHQFAGRHFKGRLPPFLEEGLACMFETVNWKDRLPRWNLSVNVPRAQTLRKALDANDIYTLDKLCSMHAGDIVGESNEKIDTFYAQSWAFARFLWEGENGKFRPALQKWLAETADGTVVDPTRSHCCATSPWNRRAVRPMIEHYTGMDIAAVDTIYRTYLRKIAYEELSAQWRSQ